jgi:DNA-binding NarL/FixJ family response regulator
LGLFSILVSILFGYSQLGPTIAPKVFAQINPPVPTENNYLHWFSNRKLGVLTLLAEGKNNREIAEMLCLTEGTVKNHTTRILGQLGVSDRTRAALWAQQHLQ